MERPVGQSVNQNPQQLPPGMPPIDSIEPAFSDFVVALESLHNQGIRANIDLTGLVDHFSQVGVTGILRADEDPRSVSPIRVAEIVKDLSIAIGFNLNKVVALNLVGTQYGIFSAEIHPDSVESFTYLDCPLRCAAVTLRVPGGDAMGFSLHNLAFYDPARIAVDCLNVLPIIPVQARSGFPYAAELKQRLTEGGFTADEYIEICGRQRMRCEEIQHAKDHIFLAATATPGGDELHRHQRLMLPESGIWNTLKSEPDKMRLAQSLGGVAEYSSSLGGIMMEISLHLNSGNPGHALLAFDDFMWVRSLRANSERSLGNSSAIAPQYRTESGIFFERLRTLVGERSSSPQGLRNLLRAASDGQTAQNALSMLTALWQLDFYSDEDRVLMVKGAVRPDQ